MNRVRRQRGFPSHQGRFLALAAGLLLFTAGEARGQFCEYEATVIRYPLECAFGEVQTIANGLNDEGWVCGYYWCPIWTISRGFYRTPKGEYVDIGLPPGGTSIDPEDINNNGQICGSVTIDGRTRGFVYDIGTGQWAVIHPDNPDRRALAKAINDAGQVCGWFDSGEVPGTAFLRQSDGTIIELEVDGTRSHAINNLGLVAGVLGHQVDEGSEGFVWDGETVTWIGFIPEGDSSAAMGVNDLGEVCAQGQITIMQSYIWVGGAAQIIQSLPELEETSALGISLNNQVIGGARDPEIGGRWTAFLWLQGEIATLDSLVTNPEVGSIETASTLNTNGQIRASGHDPQNTIIGFLLDPIDASPADADGDCDTDVWDLLEVLGDWGATVSPADLDDNGFVNVSDLLMVLANWG